MEEKSQQPAKLPESEEEQEKTIKLLEERLEEHDNNRKTVQGRLTEVLNKLTGQIGELEDRINRELWENFSSEEDKLQRTLNELRGNSTISALQEVETELSMIQSYEIIENKEANDGLTALYELKTERRAIYEDDHVGLAIPEVNTSINGPSNAAEMSEIPCGSDKFSEVRERLMELLEERLQTHDGNRKAMQDKLHEICERLRSQIGELEDRISKELEDKYASEDNRLQAALNELRGNTTASALQKAKAELLVEQSYEIIENKEVKHDLTTLYELKAERRIVPELTEMGKPTNVRIAGVNKGIVSVEFTCFNPDEERVLSGKNIVNPVKYRCLLFKKGNEQESKEYPLYKNGGNDSFLFTFTPDTLETETTYGTRVKIVTGDRESEWSDEVAEFITPEFRKCCVWKTCPDGVNVYRKYSVDGGNPRISTKANEYDGSCIITGNTHIPLNTITSWNIKILRSRDGDGCGICIGIAPSDINQNGDKYDKYGWYFDCYYSELDSGPPHNYGGKKYGQYKGAGQYVRTRGNVGVVMDTTKGELSFALNRVNLGVAYEGIPLDKPLVPCVLLRYRGDSIELDTSEAKERVDSSVPVPSNVAIKSTTWDSITLTWDEVAGASFYQIEVDGNKSWDASTKNTFTKGRLLPETEHNFRVRTVRGSSVSEWSGVVRGRTQKVPEFSECAWKKCPDYVDKNIRYSVDEGNPRIAKNISYDHCTIIGNTPIPLNKVITWGIKVLKSKDNDGNDILIGMAPSDIDQNNNNFNCDNGWYFDCFNSTLWSGPPHNYEGKEYGPRKEGGEYVHMGDSVSVVVDTTKGDLSFVLDGVDRGVAYCGIPLDKPIVPCVLLECEGDSVEFII